MGKLITRRNAAFLVFGLLIVAVAARSLINLPVVQDMALSRGASVMAERAAEPLQESDSLRVYVCGSASPMGLTDQAQACIAVLTPEHFYLIDSGADRPIT